MEDSRTEGRGKQMKPRGGVRKDKERERGGGGGLKTALQDVMVLKGPVLFMLATEFVILRLYSISMNFI